MTQTAEQRRLVRLAGRMNARARRYNSGHIAASDLAGVVLASSECFYCKIGLEIGQGTFDHKLALDKGGLNAPSNIVRCCYTCNRRKFTKTPEEFAGYDDLTVTCALPGCGKVFKPRYAEWANGRAKFCSLSHAAKSRFTRRDARP